MKQVVFFDGSDCPDMWLGKDNTKILILLMFMPRKAAERGI